jgi:hypothetical protein
MLSPVKPPATGELVHVPRGTAPLPALPTIESIDRWLDVRDGSGVPQD